LVGDADRGDRLAANLADDIDERRQGDRPDLFGVVLDPARLRVDLRELLIRSRGFATVGEDRPTTYASRACVDGDHATSGIATHRRHRSQRRRFLVDRLGRCEGPVLVRLVGAGR
jgi:hypothetical protein